MTAKPLRKRPVGLISDKDCDSDLLQAVRGVLDAAGPIVILFRPEACRTPVRYVGPGGGWTMDPASWEIVREDEEIRFVVEEGDEYAFADANGAYELRGRGTARVTEDGTVWRHLPTPVHVGGAPKRCNASCYGLRAPMPDARDPKELIALMLAYPDGEPPWGWYEIGKVTGTVTAYPNVPIFPHGLGSAKPDAPTKWGIVPTPALTDGS